MAKAIQKKEKRVFIGIKIPQEAASRLIRLHSKLKGLPLQLVPKNALHITLTPPWQEKDLIYAKYTLHQTVHKMPHFSVKLEKLSYGPDIWRPRLVWATCSSCEEIIRLKKKLVKKFHSREHLPFTPHVTIGRFKKTVDKAHLHTPLDIPINVRIPIEKIELFESPHLGGRGYKILASVHLSQNGIPH